MRPGAATAVTAATALLGLLATGAAGCRASTAAMPAATPAAPVVRALPELSIERLRADFNRDVGRQRLIALVSPS